MKINKDTYLQFLKKANEGQLEATNRLADMELKIVRELIKSELLSDSTDRYLATAQTNKTCITPKGAITLADWERDLKQNSWWYKFGSALTRVLWVLVGIIATVIGKLLIT